MKRRTRIIAGLAAVAVAAVGLAGCSSSGSASSDTIKIAYQKFGAFQQLDAQMKVVKKEYEKENPGKKVELVPIQAQENDYYTKLALMNKAPATAPDVMYEDTFLIKADAQAGYLLPLDKYTAKWKDWSQFYDNAKQAGEGVDGKTYGIPMGTDTRALWYNKDIFKKVGLPVPWQPKTWDDVLAAAKTIKEKDPGVIPFNVYSGKPQGEASTMQGFEMLLYGADGSGNTLYKDKKWVTGSKQFEDSLQFIKDVYQGGLGPTPQQALDSQVGTTIAQTWLPKGQLAIDLDGSWQSGTWLKSGTAPWPEWSDVMGQAPMPTQNGQEPGYNSMSGGWTLAVGKNSKNPQAAFDFISTFLNQKGSLKYDIENSQIAVRKDVAEDPTYDASNPTFKFFSGLVEHTNFRPATSEYSQVSNAIQVAMESVMTGQQTPKQAAAAYDKSVEQVVGKDNTVSG
ncbi:MULTISPECIES: extracellular solute-binding protein [unclassified Curtobacterium]|jgi:multiple sugar transport system substrate-binding protein|uniref:extracellular solute-binding protein n=1 Tax=unclassified Curtobacterium TaxID=257496 RepID=UPI002863E85F|nr:MULTISPECIES: extracellular solute-binding protein [unclassified Curtobacterium]MDR6169350.1 multiple sugar transport system substrate-binding protein [Curtobacterium sp. SORGH_AS_0776]MDR6572287.1 multiple sugar transport system substrate-binding protein [Curtobacterium sp. 320]